MAAGLREAQHGGKIVVTVRAAKRSEDPLGLQPDVEFRPAYDATRLDNGPGVNPPTFRPGDERLHQSIDIGGADHALVAEFLNHADDRIGRYRATLGPAAPVEESVPKMAKAVDVIGAERRPSLTLDASQLHPEVAHLMVGSSERLPVGDGRSLDVLLASPRSGEIVAGRGHFVTSSATLQTP